MESLGIRTLITTDPDLADIDGFVLSDRRVVIANWIRTDRHWQVADTTSASTVAGLREVISHASAHSVCNQNTPEGRLSDTADYLNLDWRWITHRAHDLAHHRIGDLVRPRSRLLSTDGVTLTLRYLSTMAVMPS